MDIPVGDPFNFSFATVAACGGRYNALPSKFPSELRTKCRDTRDPAANNSTCLNPRNLQHTPRAHPRQLWKESIYSPLVRFRGVFQRCVETKLRLKVFHNTKRKTSTAWRLCALHPRLSAVHFLGHWGDQFHIYLHREFRTTLHPQNPYI